MMVITINNFIVMTLLVVKLIDVFVMMNLVVIVMGMESMKTNTLFTLTLLEVVTGMEVVILNNLLKTTLTVIG